MEVHRTGFVRQLTDLAHNLIFVFQRHPAGSMNLRIQPTVFPFVTKRSPGKSGCSSRKSGLSAFAIASYG